MARQIWDAGEHGRYWCSECGGAWNLYNGERHDACPHCGASFTTSMTNRDGTFEGTFCRERGCGDEDEVSCNAACKEAVTVEYIVKVRIPAGDEEWMRGYIECVLSDKHNVHGDVTLKKGERT